VFKEATLMRDFKSTAVTSNAVCLCECVWQGRSEGLKIGAGAANDDMPIKLV